MRANRGTGLAAALAAVVVVGCSGGGGGGADGGAPLTKQQQQVYDATSPAAATAATASAQFESAVAAGQPDPIGLLVASLQADPTVVSVERYDEDGSVIVNMKAGGSFAMSLAEKNRPEWIRATGTAAPSLADSRVAALLTELAYASTIVCDPASFPQSKTACIVDCFQSEFQRDYSKITSAMSRAGFTSTTLSLKTPQDILSLRQKLPTCGILYLASHGVVGKNIEGTYGNEMVTDIATGKPGDPAFSGGIVDMMAALGGDMSKWVGIGGHKGKTYWTLTPDFFDGIKYPNTLVYADICSSDQALKSTPAKRLREVFRGNGAGAFLGWKGPITNQISDRAADEIFDGLAPKSAAANITGIAVTPTPAAPKAGESYTVTAIVQPPTAGIELRLGVSGTDGYSKDETKTTDASGRVTFSAVPGGASAVVDTVTVSAGGAGTSAAVNNVVLNDPALKQMWNLKFSGAVQGSVSTFISDAGGNFNLACNNPKLTSTQEVVKFGG